jgi:hypothetical protein
VIPVPAPFRTSWPEPFVIVTKSVVALPIRSETFDAFSVVVVVVFSIEKLPLSV